MKRYTKLYLVLLFGGLFSLSTEASNFTKYGSSEAKIISSWQYGALDTGLRAFHFVFSHSGPKIWNPADNMNVWHYAHDWHERMEKQPDDYFTRNFPYVRYIQLMTAAGGSIQRDLFKNPQDRSVTDDYDFSPLIRACRNITRQGLLPHLKLGNVPLKYSDSPQISEDFGVNVRPPHDYNLWHTYIKAMMRALIEEFGKRNVRNWRFGVITEYENKSWFSVDDDPERTRDAYFKLYDYTVDALEQALGKNICVGAHSMTVSGGLWDEQQLIAHCARGKNNCTGKTGTRLDFLAASYYDDRPGKRVIGNLSLMETINLLRDAALDEGFDKLFYGIDEGRILSGLDGKPIFPRAVGYTWQAAYDARMYRSMMDGNIDYFSHWAYTSHSIASGVPSVSAQTAALFYKMEGSVRLPSESVTNATTDGEEMGAIAAWNKHDRKLYLLVYAYSDSVHHSAIRDVSCTITGIRPKVQELRAVKSLISDDSNFFDEWVNDRERMGIVTDDFGWSSDSYVVQPPTLTNPEHLKFFESRVPFYGTCSQLVPTPELIRVENGQAHIRARIPLHGVILYEIEM